MQPNLVYLFAVLVGLAWSYVTTLAVRYALDLALSQERHGRPATASQKLAAGLFGAACALGATLGSAIVEHAQFFGGVTLFLTWFVPTLAFAVFAVHRSGLRLF